MTKKIIRPWGFYTVINKGKGFRVKLVHVLPLKRISLQKHNFRSEHWVIVQGTAKITNGKKTLILKKNQSTYIPKKGIHRIENCKNLPLKLIEIQCGECLTESDIVRFHDDHGRK